MISSFLLLAVSALLSACNIEADQKQRNLDSQDVPNIQATSLLGEPLLISTLPKGNQKKMNRQLAEAEENYRNSPDDVDAVIWVGRRTAYLGQKKEAVGIYSTGIKRFPDCAKLYRHRGHQYIGLRKLEEAIRDLEQAAILIVGTDDEIEPDGMPNKRNIPTSTLHSNIWYHLGLARYLSGDFARALDAYRECMKVSKNPDMLVATSNWLYMTLRRLGMDIEAAAVLEPIHVDMDIIENGAYHKLLLLYKGELTPAMLFEEGGDAVKNSALGYGLGNWYLYNGNKGKARNVFENIVSGAQWNAFGYIAAEAELSRM